MNFRKRPLQLAVLALATILASFGAAAAPADAATSLDVGQTKTFSHLKVTVSKVDRKSDSYFFGAKIKVCVTSLPKGQSSMRLSWDPWALNGGVQPGMFDEGQDPWAGSDAPTEGYYKVGQCMKGWLPFAVDATKNVTKISYANSLGNTTSWKVTTGKTPQRSLGSTAKFTYFTVQVTDTQQSDQGFRAWAKVCVVKLPPGSTGGKTRISWDPWVANAGTHFAYSPYVYDGSHTWANLFPQSGKYKKGQCAKGWVPFEGIPTNVGIDRVAYRNSLGNQAFWTAN